MIIIGKVIKGLGLKEALFSRSEDIDSLMSISDLVCTEVIKCMEFYHKLPEDVIHWCQNAAGNIARLNSCIGQLSYGVIFSRSIIKLNLLKGSSDIIKKTSDCYGIDYINLLKLNLINEGKYLLHINSLNDYQYNNEFYCKILSILANILNGKLHVNEIDSSSIWENKYSNLSINLSGSTKLITKSDMKDIFYRFIYSLNSYVNNGYIERYL